MTIQDDESTLNGAEVSSAIVMRPDASDVNVKVSVIEAPTWAPKEFLLGSAEGWSVETSGIIVIASRFESDDEDAQPVEVMAWPWATGGVGVVGLHTEPVTSGAMFDEAKTVSMPDPTGQSD